MERRDSTYEQTWIPFIHKGYFVPILLEIDQEGENVKSYWHTDRQTVILWNYRPHIIFAPFVL